MMAPTIQNDEIRFCFQHDPDPGIYVWAGQQTDPGENHIGWMSQPTSFLTGVNDPDQSSVQIHVSQNHPNPFRDFTMIEVILPGSSEMSFVVTDLTGKTVHEKNYGIITRSVFRLRFDDPGLPGGVYFYTVITDFGKFSGKMVRW